MAGTGTTTSSSTRKKRTPAPPAEPDELDRGAVEGVDEDDAAASRRAARSGDRVSRIAEGVEVYDLDAEAGPTKPPFVFTLGGEDWRVFPPGVGQTLDAEQAPYLEDFFRIIMGDELWEEFAPIFRDQPDASLTWKLGRRMSQAFGMDPTSMQETLDREESNRAGRRGTRRQPRRGRNGR